MRHQLVGDGSDRAVEHFGQAVIRVQFLPHRRRRQAAGEPIDKQQFLADEQPALQKLGLDAEKLRVAFEQRL